MKIDDNGTVRDMTPEEETAYRAEIEDLEAEQVEVSE